MDQMVLQDMGEPRRILANLELANRDELQQGFEELKNQLEKEFKVLQTTVEGFHSGITHLGE